MAGRVLWLTRSMLAAGVAALALVLAPSALADNTTLSYNPTTGTTTLTDDDSGSQLQLNQLEGSDCAPIGVTPCDEFSSYSGAISTTETTYCVTQTDSVFCYPADYYVLNLGGGSDNFTVANGSYFKTMTVNGGANDDSLNAGGVVAQLPSFPSAITFNGGAGNDYAQGGAGNDVLHGGDDSDRLFGGNGSDQLYGDNGNDGELLGEGGNDTIDGGPGNDIYL